MPQVSVAIPVFNAAPYIAATLRSVLAQSEQDYEIIVIDDGSTDDSEHIVKYFVDPRIRYVRQANQGVAAARNAAIEIARGGLVAFLDADDLWRQHQLRHLIAMAAVFPAAGLFGNRYVEVDNPTATLAQSDAGDLAPSYRQLDDYFATWVREPTPFHTSSSMVRRDVALRIGGFPVGHSRGEDLAFFIRAALEMPTVVSTYLGCLYRRATGGLTSRIVLEPDIAMQTISCVLDRNSPDHEHRQQALREYYYKIAMAHCLDCLLLGHEKAAHDFLRLSSRTKWQRQRWWQSRLMAALPREVRGGMRSLRGLLEGGRS